MLLTYLTGVGVIVVVVLGWTGTQIAWRSVFADLPGDPDVLARRGSCKGCTCIGTCERTDGSRVTGSEEETK